MLFSRPGFDDAVSDITTLLAEQAPEVSSCDEETQARMRQIRRAVMGRPRNSARHRSWWPGRPQRQRRRAVLTCVAIPVLLAATAAGWAIAVSPPASFVTNDVLCFQKGVSPDQVPSPSAASTLSDGASPTALCAHLWATGVVTGDPHDHFVPPLTACALPPPAHPNTEGVTGQVGVFPYTTCARLGLAQLPRGYDRAARRFSALDRYLSAGAHRCMSPAATVGFARQALRIFGYRGWRITFPWGLHPKGTKPGACWEGKADSAGQAVQVLPVPVPGYADYPLLRVLSRALKVPEGACSSGNPPEDAAVVIARLKDALRRAGYGTWKITLFGGRANRESPCYQPMTFTLSRHSFQLTPAIFTGTGFK